jgi:ectoine hydroxylase-related dioxygenase (phytanoyl-CoA dioxygenase family)
VIANVYLDDVTARGGSLRVISRSHGHLRPSGATGKRAVTLSPEAQIIEPQALAGDVLWFHLWTVHGSGPNHSASVRRSVRCGYIPQSLHEGRS